MKASACSPYTVSIAISVWASHGSKNVVCAKIITLLVLAAILAARGSHAVNVLIAALALLNNSGNTQRTQICWQTIETPWTSTSSQTTGLPKLPPWTLTCWQTTGLPKLQSKLLPKLPPKLPTNLYQSQWNVSKAASWTFPVAPFSPPALENVCWC